MTTKHIEDITLTRAGTAPDPPTAFSTPEALSSDNVELMFDGVGDSDTGSARWITITLKPSDSDQKYPFIRCTKEIGFNHLPPDDLKVSWEGSTLSLTVES